MDERTLANLSAEAVAAREAAYAPYSGFKVGAALLTSAGKVYRGCNVENAAYSPSLCAERTAFCTAVAAGERQFSAIAVAGWGADEVGMAFPCGVCRQVMMEFCVPAAFQVIVTDAQGNWALHTLAELLPRGFGPENLTGGAKDGQ